MPAAIGPAQASNRLPRAENSAMRLLESGQVPLRVAGGVVVGLAERIAGVGKEKRSADLLPRFEAGHVIDRRRCGIAAAEQVDRLAARGRRCHSRRNAADDIARCRVAHRVDRGENAVHPQPVLPPVALRMRRTGRKYRRCQPSRKPPEKSVGEAAVQRYPGSCGHRGNSCDRYPRMLPMRRRVNEAILLAIIVCRRLSGRKALSWKMVSAVGVPPKLPRGGVVTGESWSGRGCTGQDIQVVGQVVIGIGEDRIAIEIGIERMLRQPDHRRCSPSPGGAECAPAGCRAAPAEPASS